MASFMFRRLNVFAVLAVFFSMPLPAHAQQATITGRVINDTGAPVAGVVVRVVVRGVAEPPVETDTNGLFSLTVPASGNAVQIMTTAEGFVAQTVDVVVATQRAEVEIVVHRNPEYREEVEVT